MRNDLHGLLHLRPKIAKPLTPPPPRPVAERDRTRKPSRGPSQPPRPAKKGKGKSRGASKGSKSKTEWCTTYKGVEICRRYQTGLCTSDTCQFAHVCAITHCGSQQVDMRHRKAFAGSALCTLPLPNKIGGSADPILALQWSQYNTTSEAIPPNRQPDPWATPGRVRRYTLPCDYSSNQPWP